MGTLPVVTSICTVEKIDKKVVQKNVPKSTIPIFY